MRTETEIVDKAKAEEYLKLNVGNRPLDKAYVRGLAQELEQGRWEETHQGIAFDVNGRLVDGQHRLHAIAITGIPAKLSVSRDLPETAVRAIDQHRRRTAAQVLAMQTGLKVDAPRLTSMARVILQVVLGQTRASNNSAAFYAAEHLDTLTRYLRIARDYSPPVAAAFAWAELLGWDEVGTAGTRLVETLWDSPGDPMRALATRAKSWQGKRGASNTSARDRFNIALNCLLAVHEGKDLSVARTVQPNYEAIATASGHPEAASIAPPANMLESSAFAE